MFNQAVSPCTVVIQDKDVVCTIFVVRFRELDQDVAVFDQFQEKCAMSTVARLCFSIVLCRDNDVVCTVVVVRFRELDQDISVFNKFQDKCAMSTVARLCFQIGMCR